MIDLKFEKIKNFIKDNYYDNSYDYNNDDC